MTFPADAQRPLERDELTEYGGAAAKLVRLASQAKPDLALGKPLGAQWSSALDAIIKQASAHSDFALVFRRRPLPLCSWEACVFADSAFANAVGHKSQ